MVVGGARKGLGVSFDGRLIARRVGRAESGSGPGLGVSLGGMCFPNRAESVSLVRRFVGLVACVFGVGHVGETAALLVSELAGNVTLHVQGGEWFEVVVGRRDEFLRVEVRDGSAEFPVRRCPAMLEESGRGLVLVMELAAGHGMYRLPRGGKAVWFELLAWDQPTASLADYEL